MKFNVKLPIFALMLFCFIAISFSTQLTAQNQLVIFDGFFQYDTQIHIDDAHSKRNWLKPGQDMSMQMTYPGGMPWGVAFITFGSAYSDASCKQRTGQDLSKYTTLVVDMRAATKGQIVNIGMKDCMDRSDGSETKIPQKLTPEWVTYRFKLSDFKTCDLTKVHIPIEFVYGEKAATVLFRNVRFEINDRDE